MPGENNETSNDNTHEDQLDLSSWNAPDRTETALDVTNGDTDSEEPIEELPVDWHRREFGDNYPVDANYHCNECNEFHTDHVSELKNHIEEEEDIEWGKYLEQTGLHRCCGCGRPLRSVSNLYCFECDGEPNDRIPCRNCGEVRVNIADPFCSPSCAGERLRFGDPLEPPKNPTDDWLDHPHRLHNGIPSGAPFVANNDLACRKCYLYGSDKLHKFAVHVSEGHVDEGGWGAYINEFELRTCRVCDEPLQSLLPLYCSDECQHNDPDPVKTCVRDDCDNGVERRQRHCSRGCAVKTAGSAQGDD